MSKVLKSAKKVRPSARAKSALKQEKEREKKAQAAIRAIQLVHAQVHREIQYGQHSIKLHEKRWRKMLCDIAVPQMRQELEYMWHTFEKTIEDKDFEISFLLDNLKEAEEQYRMNFSQHIDSIDAIILMCHDQVGDLWGQSKNIIGDLFHAAIHERADVSILHKEHEEQFKTMIHMQAKQKKESAVQLRGEYISQNEVEISKLNDARQKFNEDLTRRYTKICTSTLAFLRHHIRVYTKQKDTYDLLSRSDQKMQATIAGTWCQIQESLEIIKILKSKLNDLELNQKRRIHELTNETKHFETIYKLLKNRVMRERVMDDLNVRYLTVLGNDIMEHIRKYEKRGEQLLSLSAINRKFETEEEKIMCYPKFNVHIPDKSNIGIVDSLYSRYRKSARFSGKIGTINKSKIKNMQQKTEQKQEEKTYLKEMKFFWLRLGAVEASRQELAEEVAVLRKENTRLRLELFDYCGCFNCGSQLKLLYENPKFGVSR